MGEAKEFIHHLWLSNGNDFRSSSNNLSAAPNIHNWSVCDDFFCWEQQHQQQPKSKKKKKSLSALVYTAKKKKRKVYELVTVVANASKIGARLSLSLFYRPSVYITAQQQLKGKRRRRRRTFFSFFFSWRPTTSACGKSYLMLHHTAPAATDGAAIGFL